MSQLLSRVSLSLSGLLLLIVFSGCQPQNAVFTPGVSKLLTRATQLKEENKLDEAICRVEAAADIAPELFEVQYNLGVLYIEANKPGPAVEHLEQALKISPKQPKALFSLGAAYAAQLVPPTASGVVPATNESARQKAIDAFEQYLSIAPENDSLRADAESQVASLKQ